MEKGKMDLSHTKLRFQLQSIRSEIIRARVRTCRKLSVDIKKWSKKQLVESKKEKSARKVQRLTDELHALRKMKPNIIAKFVLSKTEDFVEALKKNPDTSLQLRALAKLYSNKLITPILKQFREKFPKWQETLPKLLEKDPEVIDTGGIMINNNMNDLENTSSLSNSDGGSSEDEESRSDEDSISENGCTTSNKQENCIKNVGDGSSKSVNKEGKFSGVKQKELNGLSITETRSPSKVSPPLKKLKSSRTSTKTTESESEYLNTSGDYRNSWIVENMVDNDLDDVALPNNSKERLDDRSVFDVGKQISLHQKNIKDACVNEDSSSATDSEEDSDDSFSQDTIENLNPSTRHNGKRDNSREITDNSCKESKLIFSAVESDAKSSDSESELPTEPIELDRRNSSKTKQPTISKNIDSNISKNDSETIQLQKHEDPFFLTSDNSKYMTLAKIEEPKLQVLPSANVKMTDKPFKRINNERFNNIDRRPRAANQGSRNRYQFETTKINDKPNSTVDNSIKLHPSWEAKKKNSTILPFQGKKISFD